MQLRVIVAVEAFDGGFLDGPVHPLDLPVGPRMLNPSQAVFDAVFLADPTKDVMEGVSVRAAVGELDAVVGEHRVQGVWHRRDHIAQELRCCHLVSRRMQFSERELGRSVDGNEEIELALSRLHFGDVNVEIADGVALEPLPGGLVTLDIGQA